MRSIANQTELPLEVIVVDDSPSEAVKEVVEKYERAFPTPLVYVRSGKGSLPAARNVGLGKSSGRVILFLDTDVVLTKNFVEELALGTLKYWDAYGFTGADEAIKCPRAGYARKLFSRLSLYG